MEPNLYVSVFMFIVVCLYVRERERQIFLAIASHHWMDYLPVSGY